MALKATIFKCDLSLADLDRHYYADHQLTLARHPSENDERMMLRLLAFIYHAHERLSFTKGLSTEGVPDLWQKDYADHIECWIEVGLPSEKRVRQACHKAERVILYCYGGRTVQPWWQKMQQALERFDNLTIFEISSQDSQNLSHWAERNMQLQATIQETSLTLSRGNDVLYINPSCLKA